MAQRFYEDLVKEEEKRKGAKFETLAAAAIAARGGHCIGCENCNSLTAVKPKRIPMPLRADNLSVRVDCKIDRHKHYPFQNLSVSQEFCPVVTRSQNRQQKQISE